MTRQTAPQKPPVLKIERTFEAWPELLWTYWTDPKKYAKWLNPAGLDLVIHEFDVRPGGKVRFDMPQPDGNKNPQEGVFHSLTPYTEIVTGAPDKSFLIKVTFTPVTPGRTRMTVEVTGVPPEFHPMATQGWNTGLDHLEGLLSRSSGQGFTIERVFKTTPQKLYEMWTTKKALEKWFGAGDFTVAVTKLDVRVGGEYAFEFRTPDFAGVNHGRYTKVEPGKRLSWTWEFDIFLAPGQKPYDVPIDVRFEAVPGGTKMTFTQGPLASDEHTEGSRQGVLANFDRLAQLLTG